MIEETTQADAPPQLYKPGLKRLWKMEPNEPLEEANQKRPGPFYKAEITWKAPKDTGGLPITEYCLQQRIADRNQSWEIKYRGKNESTVVDNLPPGSRIEFRVQVCASVFRIKKSRRYFRQSLPQVLQFGRFRNWLRQNPVSQSHLRRSTLMRSAHLKESLTISLKLFV